MPRHFITGTWKTLVTCVAGALLVSITAYGQDDIALWTAGTWNIGDITNNGSFQWTTNFHLGASYATIGDYNGDGNIDLGEVQENSPFLYWYWNLNNGAGGWNKETSYTILGLSASDLPCTGDFNGDGKTDIAVFRSGTWYISYAPCSVNTYAAISATGNFGVSGDIPVPGDYNGDGICDMAVFRPGSGTWYVSFSTTNGPNFNGPYAINGVTFGLPGDIPAVGDVDGDGYADMILFRPSTHQVLINLHNPNKPTFQGYGDANGYGSVDLVYTYSNANPSCVVFGDVAHNRPVTAAMPPPANLGIIEHGWSCIFDNSLDVTNWTAAWQSMGINEVEFFSWMRAHEEVDPLGPSWNTWVGDERLWTTKTMLQAKIAGVQSIGAKAICYDALYAATPAFASEHPEWEMLDTNSLAPLDYPPGSGFLYLMCINPKSNYPYTINGTVYTNFSQYLIAQAVAAQQQFNWDGWRWDWYGIPSNYVCQSLNGTGNLPGEIGGMVGELSLALKAVRSDCVVSALQLPATDSDIPLNDTAPVVDQQYLEIWPDGAGPNYSSIYNAVNSAATAFGDKPVIANCYPQTNNFPGGWLQPNIDYQFATCLSAGGYPGAQLVDGTGSFTADTPMSEVRYPDSVLERIGQWNVFDMTYGGYYYLSSPTYLIRNPERCSFSVNSGSPLVYKAKERRDKRTFQMDTVIVDLINYGATNDLTWDAVNAEPAASAATITVGVPSGVTLSGAYLISPDLGTNGATPLAMTHTGTNYTVTTPAFTLFGTVVFTTPYCANLPSPPVPAPVSFPNYPISYDTEGTTLNGSTTTWAVLDGIASPLPLNINYNGQLSSWSFSTNAYYGSNNPDAQSVAVTPGQLLFTSTSEHAIRCALTNFSDFQVAVRADPGTTQSWFGFRLYNPTTAQVSYYYYRIGAAQTNLPSTLVNTSTSNGWQFITRSLYNDVTQGAAFGSGWPNAVVTGVMLGPVAGGNAYYDTMRLFTPSQPNATGPMVAPGGLIDWWPADGNAQDIVGGDNGVLIDGCTYAPGEDGQAFQFDGTSGYVALANSIFGLPAPWTVCLWVYRQQTPQSSAALLSDGIYTLKLEQLNGAHEVGMSELGVADWVFTNSSYVVPLETWTHLAFVSNGSSTTLYVNGVQTGVLNASMAVGRKSLGAADLNSMGYTDYMEGRLDDVMIYDKALSGSQIQAIYNTGTFGLVRSPQFLGVTFNNGNLTYSLEGLTGSKNFTIYYSTNLTTWTVLGTLSAANGTNQFTISPTNSAAFYRLVQQ